MDNRRPSGLVCHGGSPRGGLALGGAHRLTLATDIITDTNFLLENVVAQVAGWAAYEAWAGLGLR